MYINDIPVYYAFESPHYVKYGISFSAAKWKFDGMDMYDARLTEW